MYSYGFIARLVCFAGMAPLMIIVLKRHFAGDLWIDLTLEGDDLRWVLSFAVGFICLGYWVVREAFERSADRSQAPEQED